MGSHLPYQLTSLSIQDEIELMCSRDRQAANHTVRIPWKPVCWTCQSRIPNPRRKRRFLPLKRCLCQRTRYCSSTCRLQDWARHKSVHSWEALPYTATIYLDKGCTDQGPHHRSLDDTIRYLVATRQIHPDRLTVERRDWRDGQHHTISKTHVLDYVGCEQAKFLLEHGLSMVLLAVRCSRDEFGDQVDFLKLGQQYGSDGFYVAPIRDMLSDDSVLRWMVQDMGIPVERATGPTFGQKIVSTPVFQYRMDWLLDQGYEVDQKKIAIWGQAGDSVCAEQRAEQRVWLQNRLHRRNAQVGQLVDQSLGDAYRIPQVITRLVSSYYV
jgi:hypothetical protein